jgi:ketosteroid isomerase-like protein
MADHKTTVASIYEAFGRGDVPAILETLADDVRWEEWTDNQAQKSDVPWLRARRGKTGVGEFFAIAGQLTIHEFRVLSILAGGDQVAAEVIIDATTPSGARYRDEELHLWTFDDAGKVARLRHYVDTAKQIAAARGDA